MTTLYFRFAFKQIGNRNALQYLSYIFEETRPWMFTRKRVEERMDGQTPYLQAKCSLIIIRKWKSARHLIEKS